MKYWITWESVKKYVNSEAKKESDRKEALIKDAYSQLSDENKKECLEFAEIYLKRDDERDQEVESNIVDEDVVANEQHEELAEIVPKIIKWFPFVSQYPPEIQEEFAVVYLEVMWHLSGRKYPDEEQPQ